MPVNLIDTGEAPPTTRIVVRPPDAYPMLPDYDPTMYQSAQAPENNLNPPAQEEPAPSQFVNRLFGLNGQERYQTWPEKLIRSGFTAPGDAVSGDLPMWDPETGHTSEAAIQRAQDTAGLAMIGGLAGTGEGGRVLGSGPVRGPNMKFKKVTGPEASDPNYVYHATSAERAHDIANEGLKLHEPHEFTDQEIWPDGKVEPRNYFTQTAGNTWQFAPEEGSPALLRVRKDAHPFKRESTGDIYSTKPVPADKIEYLDETGKWMALGAKNEAAAPLSALGKRGPIWHSPVENALEQSTTGSAPGKQWLATLQNARGVKPEELDWTGLRDFLTERADQRVTRKELHEHLDRNRVQLQDVEKSGTRPGDQLFDTLPRQTRDRIHQEFVDDFGEEPSTNELRNYYEDYQDHAPTVPVTKYHDYQLPGGENYREHLLTLPGRGITEEQALAEAQRFSRTLGEDWSKLDAATQRRAVQSAREELQKKDNTFGGQSNYNSSHWDEPNIVAHVRTNDRMMSDKKSLHIEEVQSDWHQAGRKEGYNVPPVKSADLSARKSTAGNWDVYHRDGRVVDTVHASSAQEAVQHAMQNMDKEDRGGIPDAPFKTTWPELAMKRMVRRAAEEGYDRISWTPGEAQAARYDLSKQVDKVHYNPEMKTLAAYKDGKAVINKSSVEPKDLSDLIGKEAAEKLINSPTRKAGSTHELTGQDLKVGGEGMREFYDRMLPRVAEKIGRAHGVRVQLHTGKVGRSLEDELRNRGMSEKSFNELSLSQRNKILEKVNAGAPVHYFDIPQSLRDQALQKGMPLFSGGRMFIPATTPQDDKGEKK